MRSKKIAILTSGGDAPGMNAALFGVASRAAQLGPDVFGVMRGYQGLLNGEIHPLGDISHVLPEGGTILRTSRSPEFRGAEGLRKATRVLEGAGIDALFAIGGDGTFRGCVELAKHWSGQILGIPATIDNDIWGTDYTIGFDTAVNTALKAIDGIRHTADSHERVFLVEVMGRHSGFIALEVGLAGGAGEILVPEIPIDFNAVVERLKTDRIRGKAGGLMVVAEGAYPGGAAAVSAELRKLDEGEYRVCVLGHVQRGGSPTAADRLLAIRLGSFAVEAALAGESGKMVGEANGRNVLEALETVAARKKPLDPRMLPMSPRWVTSAPASYAPAARR